MECRHIYPDGQRCRCRATASHVFCRQHAPQPRVPTLRNRVTPFRRWIELRRALPNLDRAEIRPAILWVLSLLLQEGPRTISDANAGVLLRYLVRTWGSVPFGLADDPAPAPDSALALSRSIDRLMTILRRHADDGPGRTPGMDSLVTQEGTRIMSQANSLGTSAESSAVPRSTPRGVAGPS